MPTSRQSASSEANLSAWQQWLQHPEKLRLHKILFQAHLWTGLAASLYLLMMSLSGSAIIYRNNLERSGKADPQLIRAVEWLVDLHENLLLGMAGRRINGIGACCATLVGLTGAVIWWPGIAHWRRSLTVNWKTTFARLNWDLHNAVGFWCFPFVMLWGISGFYFCFPEAFDGVLNLIDPTGVSRAGRFADDMLLWLSNLHFGRFNWFSEALWTFAGLALAALAVTGVFMSCHRFLFALPHPSRLWRLPDEPKPLRSSTRVQS